MLVKYSQILGVFLNLIKIYDGYQGEGGSKELKRKAIKHGGV
jgi:hypothetical protein